MGQKGSKSTPPQNRNVQHQRGNTGYPKQPTQPAQQPGNPAQQSAGTPYSYRNNFDSTLTKICEEIRGRMDNGLTAVDNKYAEGAFEVVQCFLIGLLKRQKGQYGSGIGISKSGSFYEGMTWGDSYTFKYIIGLEDVGKAIVKLQNAPEPGFVDIDLETGNSAGGSMQNIINALTKSTADEASGAFWKDVEMVVNNLQLPQGWVPRVDTLLKSSFIIDGASVSLLYTVKLPQCPKPAPITINLTIGIPLPARHFPTQIDILQRMPRDHPMYDMIVDILRSSEIFVLVENKKLKLYLASVVTSIFQRMPHLIKSAYLTLRAFRDKQATSVFSMGKLPRYATSSYILKTLFLHELITNPDGNYWSLAKGIEPNPPHTRDFMADRLMSLLLRWSKALKSVNLANVFISSANVLSPTEDYEDDDDFLDGQLHQVFKSSVPDIYNTVNESQRRMDQLQERNEYRVPANNGFNQTSTVVQWMFLDENFRKGRTFQYTHAKLTVQ
ncbi:unnamed protein product [Owenia fusiformis]|uniref:Uncharacterized protein n=1 Tax=Owenia fusiformis TaxID=6347 RepID=A0A8J1TAQ0_OWEFU|nr:unnamed protein product [Owenia fusiformis]